MVGWFADVFLVGKFSVDKFSVGEFTSVNFPVILVKQARLKTYPKKKNKKITDGGAN